MNLKKKERYGRLLVTALTAVCLAGCALTAPSPGEELGEEMTVLTIGTADSGGTMYPVGRAIATQLEMGVADMKVNTNASSGSYANVEGLRSKQIDLGLVSGDVAYNAYTGRGEFEKKPMEQLRVIGAVYTSLSHWIVLESEGITSVSQLQGRRVALGPEASTTELSAHTALGVLGIDSSNTRFVNYGFGSGGDALVKGSIDGLHGFAGIPVSGLESLAKQVPCRILGYEPPVLEQILERNPVYSRFVIPAGTYQGQEEAVTTFGVKCLLVVREDMDEQLVYQMTSILHQAAPQLAQAHAGMAEMSQDGFMFEDVKIPLHEGAQRYYREQGLLP